MEIHQQTVMHILEIATSDDNVTYTSFRNFVIGNYTCRYFKFRLVMTSADLSSTPVVSALTVTVDMPDRIFSGNDITSGTSTYTVTFTNPFKSVNYATGITMENANTGDYFTVSNKTINGFDVAFFNSSDTGVSRIFDYIAKGLLKKIYRHYGTTRYEYSQSGLSSI
jgi:hypothetical protein